MRAERMLVVPRNNARTISTACFLLICLIEFRVGHLTAADDIARDRAWARRNSNSEASSEVVLGEYNRLWAGESAAIASFRSIFSEHLFRPRRLAHGVREEPTRYLLFVPVTATPRDKRPLIVWLHGSGDGEVDLQHHLTGLARLFFPPPWHRDMYEFFLLSVLRPAKCDSWSAPRGRGDMLRVVSAIIDKVIEEYPIDVSRVSLVGASSGGTACWELAIRTPDRFAGVAPLASGGAGTPRLARVARLPIWAFHSAGDDAVPIDGVRRTVKSLADAGGIVRLTEFYVDDHDAWTPAFDDYDLLSWLLAQHLGDPKRYVPGVVPLATRARPLINTVRAAAVWAPWLIVPAAAIVLLFVRILKARAKTSWRGAADA